LLLLLLLLLLFLLLTMADVPADEPRDVPERAPRTKRWNQIAAIKLKQSNEFLQETTGRVHQFVDLMNSTVQEVAAEFLFEEVSYKV
jgi:hypothetical protein